MLTWRLGWDRTSGRFFVDMVELNQRLDGGQNEYEAMARLAAWVRLYVAPEGRA